MKKILLSLSAALCLLIAAPALLLPVPAIADNIAAGDSYTKSGIGATVPAAAYLPLVQTATGLTFSNQAIDGGMACDMSSRVYGFNQGATDKSIVQLFANEAHVYLTSQKQAYGRACHLSTILSLAAPARTMATAMTASPYVSGSWVTFSNAAPWAGCMQSWLGGSSLTGTFSGTALYVTVQLTEPQAGFALAGTANVLIDGQAVGTITSDGTGMTTGQGTTAAPAAYRFQAMSAGSHTAQIVMTSDVHTIGGLLRFCSIAGSDQPVKPLVVIGNIPRWTAAAYASTAGASDATVLSFTTIANDNQQKTAFDGLNTKLVDNYTDLYPPTTYMLDLHPNDAGYAQMAVDYASQLGAVPSSPTYVPAYIFTNGINYFGASDAAGTLNLKQLSQ